MKQMTKRLVSFVLALVVCASVALPVFAAGEPCVVDHHSVEHCDEAGVNYTVKYTVAPTCEGTGRTVYQCDCGATFLDDFTAALGHDYVESTPAKDPTCTEAGATVEKKCSRCDSTIASTVIPAHGHSYGAPVVNGTTCGAAGATSTVTCEVCGDAVVTDLAATEIGRAHV